MKKYEHTKLYASMTDYYLFINWINRSKLTKECYLETKYNLVSFINPISHYEYREKMFLVGNFPYKLTKWLKENCDLDFIQKQIN